MGFFYQAIKKATGETTEPETQDVVSAEVAVATAVTPHAAAAAAPATTPKRSKLQRLALPQKLEKLVAVLSPPVLDGHVSAMEECRLLRSRIRETMRAKKHKTLMITSSNAGEGKTLISVNLAFAMSQLENTRVLLIDGDLRRPTISAFLKIPGSKGLATYLAQSVPFEDACFELSNSLHVMPAGEATEDAAQLLHSNRMELLLAYAAEHYDIVLIDAPPVLPIADAQVMAPLMDAAVLVVRADASSYQAAAQAAEILKGKCIGTILNCSSVSHTNAYYTYGPYRSKHAEAVR